MVAANLDGATPTSEAGYEAPTVTVHGSLADVTAASLFGTHFDKSIPAGTSITAVFGATSL